ncbi:zf-CCHC domain-containing protein, partial [Cephalotus follicularis]
RNRSNQSASQGSNTKPGGCFHCGREGHQHKDCWMKHGLCLRCGTAGHLARDCPRECLSNQSASQGSNTKPGACYAYGRMDHIKRDCWLKRGLCMRCGESGHLARDCPRGQMTAPTGPASGSG